jgi:hypothetical protein
MGMSCALIEPLLVWMLADVENIYFPETLPLVVLMSS